MITAVRSIGSWLERGLRMGTEISSAMTAKQERVSHAYGGRKQMILEKGVPVPKKKRGKWDFLDDMQLGESLMVTTRKDYENARSAMRFRKMKYRSMKDPAGTGWRIWRVA